MPVVKLEARARAVTLIRISSAEYIIKVSVDFDVQRGFSRQL
jgi:hypothetical protein